jgi:hypothetical protein
MFGGIKRDRVRTREGIKEISPLVRQLLLWCGSRDDLGIDVADKAMRRFE